MLTFFRRIRKGLLDGGRTSKPASPAGRYLLYAIGEIALVVIGILIALQINNWNESRKLKNLEKEMLSELNISLKRDLSDIEYNIQMQREAYESQGLILEWLDSDRPYVDSLCHHFSKAHLATVFISNDGSFETLKTLGLGLISNDSLRNKISSLYDHNYDHYNDLERRYSDLVQYMFSTTNEEYFDKTEFFDATHPDMLGCMTPIDEHRIKTDNVFKYHLNTVRSYNILVIENVIAEARAELINLIGMIEKELE
jgi:hypothetical protein